jgi:uncharacterized surface protein with fasciclin (FAS1) repeats
VLVDSLFDSLKKANVIITTMTQQLSYKFFKEKDGHYWEASHKGVLVGRSSQYFAGKSGAQYNAHLLGFEERYSDNVDWQFSNPNEKGWVWNAFSTANFEEIGAAHKTFKSIDEAKQNATLFGYDDSKAAVTTSADTGEKSLNWLWWLLAALAALALILFWPQISTALGFNKPNVVTVGTQVNTSETSKLNELVKLAGLEDVLKDKNQKYTLLAPVNNAFGQFSSQDITKLTSDQNRGVLKELLTSHVYKTDVSFDQLVEGLKLTSLNDKVSVVTKNNDKTYIDGVEVLSKGTKTDNGTVYTMASVLHTDGLLAKLVDPIIVSSSSSEVMSSKSVESSESQSSVSSSSVSSSAPVTITAPTSVVALLSADPKFSTLVTAVKAAGLVETLDSTTVTVFAPTNEAFTKLPTGELDRLLKPENKTELANLLRYHVLKGGVPSATIATSAQLSTLLGNPIYVTIMDGEPHLVTNQTTHAHITQKDLQTQKGIVHVIDLVLIPFSGK